MEYVFWISLLLLIYIYFGYPLVVLALGALVDNRPKQSEEYCPFVTVLITAFNEEKHIGATVQNKLSLDYPGEKFEVIVVSDQSTDNTDSIVNQIADSRVHLKRQEPRQGKTAGLNYGFTLAKGEIVVLSDANSVHERGALRSLIANFADSRVGYVTGKMIYANPDGSVVGDGCSAYMRYENKIRQLESRISSVVGVDGGIDAVRKNLFQPMKPSDLPDFVLPLNVVKQGYRVVYEDKAVLVEEALSDASSEYRMRVRVSLRAFWAIWDMKSMLNPRNGALYAWQLWSHKLFRYLAFLPLLAAMLSHSALVIRGTSGYLFLLFPHVLFYCLGGFGFLLRNSVNQPLLTRLPFYFFLVNTACLHAFWKWLRGQRIVIWSPRTG